MSTQTGGPLSDALRAALDGEAVALLGAGYARGATNLAGRALPTALDLAKRLAEALSIEWEPGTSLADIAEFYAAQDDRGLHNFLQNEFQIQATLPEQKVIAGLPWRRVYTTNYDDVFEQGARQARRAFYSAIPADSLEVIRKSPNVCVHINGAVSRLPAEGFAAQFRLTESSYANSSFLDTPWATQFTKDIYNARAVFFIGYSLHDLDVQRILAEMDSIAQKVWFVVGNSRSPIVDRKLSRFGRIFDGGIQELATSFSSAATTHVPRTARQRLPACLAVVEPPSSTQVHTASAIANLFLAGEIEPGMLWHVEPNGSSEQAQYLCSRHRTEEIAQQIRAGNHVVLTGGLGSGKTVLLESLAVSAFRSGIHPYRLKPARSDQERAELSEFLSQTAPLLLIADMYDQLELELQAAMHARGAGVQLLLAARPLNHDVARHWLAKLVEKDYHEYPLEDLNETELDWFIARFDEGAFWGSIAGLGLDAKRRHLRSQYGGDLCAMLLGLLKSGTIRQRIDGLVKDLEQVGQHIDAVTLVLILSVTEQVVDESRIAELLGSDALSRAAFRASHSVATFLQSSDGSVRARSSIVARYILKECVNPMRTIRVLERAVRAAEQMSSIDDSMERLAVELVRAARVQSILPESDKRPVVEFYESVRDVHFFQRNVHFWLQYAIALMAVREYADARRKLDTAYGLADRNFRTFMLDTTSARLYLEQIVHSSFSPSTEEAMLAFRKSRELLSGVLTDRERDQAFRAAERYADFLRRFDKDLSPDERYEVARAIVHVLKTIEKRGSRGAGIRVAQCEKKLRAVLESSFDRGVIDGWFRG